MDEEKKENGLESLGDFGGSMDDLSEFGSLGGDALDVEEEDVVLAEDLDGFAKGFPAWDLLPPKE